MKRIIHPIAVIVPGDATHEHRGYLLGPSYAWLQRWHGVTKYDIWRPKDEDVSLYADTLVEAKEVIDTALSCSSPKSPSC